MARPSDLYEPADNAGGVVMYAGKFDEDATSVDDLLEVIADGFDKNSTWGPAPWMPRVDDAGSPVLPQRGDRCVIALAETETQGTAEIWIIGWWPSG